MKTTVSRFGILGLLAIATVAAALTFAYAEWYAMIRVAILVPLMVSVFVPGLFGRVLRTVFGFLGSAGFGFFVCLWSAYPIRHAFPGIGETAGLGIEIGLLAVFTVLFVLRELRVLKSPVPLRAAGIPVLVLVAVFLAYHGFIQPAGISVEFVSYLPFYAALILLGENPE